MFVNNLLLNCKRILSITLLLLLLWHHQKSFQFQDIQSQMLHLASLPYDKLRSLLPAVARKPNSNYRLQFRS